MAIVDRLIGGPPWGYGANRQTEAKLLHGPVDRIGQVGLRGFGPPAVLRGSNPLLFSRQRAFTSQLYRQPAAERLGLTLGDAEYRLVRGVERPSAFKD